MEAKEMAVAVLMINLPLAPVWLHWLPFRACTLPNERMLCQKINFLSTLLPHNMSVDDCRICEPVVFPSYSHAIMKILFANFLCKFQLSFFNFVCKYAFPALIGFNLKFSIFNYYWHHFARVWLPPAAISASNSLIFVWPIARCLVHYAVVLNTTSDEALPDFVCLHTLPPLLVVFIFLPLLLW